MTSQTLRFFLNQPLKQWLTGKKEGKTKIQKFEYLQNKKSFLDLKGYHLVKNKNLIKISGRKL